MRGTRTFVVALVLASCGVAASAYPAAAQACDPNYGCDEPVADPADVLGTEETRPDPACTTSGEGTAGSRMSAVVAGVPAGTEVRLLLDGVEVGRETATSTTSDGRATVPFTFVMPAVGGPARVEAVGAGVAVECPPAGVSGVVGTRAPQQRGALPRTGMFVAAWVLLAIVLIAGGRGVLAGARHPRRAGRTGH